MGTHKELCSKKKLIVHSFLLGLLLIQMEPLISFLIRLTKQISKSSSSLVTGEIS